MLPGTIPKSPAGDDAGTPYSETSATPAGAGAFATYTMVAREWLIDNGATINSVGLYSTTAISVTIKIVKRNSTGNYDIVVSELFSHGGTGWEDFTLSSPYVVPATGDYHAAGYSTTNIIANSSTLRAYRLGNITGLGQGSFSEDLSNTPAMRVTGTI